MHIDLCDRIDGKQDRPSLIIEGPPPPKKTLINSQMFKKNILYQTGFQLLPRPWRGLRGIVCCEVLFSPGQTGPVCLCVCVCPANILVFYFSAIRRDIDLKFMQDTYRVVLNS